MSFDVNTKVKNKQYCFCLFQDKKSQAPRESLPLVRAATHAGQAEERDRGNQSGPGQCRFQKEPRWFHPARPCKVTHRPTELLLRVRPLDPKENVSVDAVMHQQLRKNVCLDFNLIVLTKALSKVVVRVCFFFLIWSFRKAFVLKQSSV